MNAYQRRDAPHRTIAISESPVLVLWAAVVAERLGFDRSEALSLGKAFVRMKVRAKGPRVGSFKAHEENATEARRKTPGDEFWVELCGRSVPVINTGGGIRAVLGTSIVAPKVAQESLVSAFGNDLDAARKAMSKLAESYLPKELANIAFVLYEQFRPKMPAGARDWATKGELDLGLIVKLSDRNRC